MKQLDRKTKFELARNNFPALISAGYSLSDLISAGYSLSDLISAGYSLSALRSAGYSLSDLISAGYSASALRSAGYSASALRSAGYSASDLISAGYSASALISAGYSASDLISAGYSLSDLDDFEKAPVIKNFYSDLLADVKAKKRIHKQSTFGPEYDECLPENTVCGTPMCTAGHWVQRAGAYGIMLRKKYGYEGAANILHAKSYPDYPAQNYGAIPQDWAMAYIEEMAKVDKKLNKKK